MLANGTASSGRPEVWGAAFNQREVGSLSKNAFGIHHVPSKRFSAPPPGFENVQPLFVKPVEESKLDQTENKDNDDDDRDSTSSNNSIYEGLLRKLTRRTASIPEPPVSSRFNETSDVKNNNGGDYDEDASSADEKESSILSGSPANSPKKSNEAIASALEYMYEKPKPLPNPFSSLVNNNTGAKSPKQSTGEDERKMTPRSSRAIPPALQKPLVRSGSQNSFEVLMGGNSNPLSSPESPPTPTTEKQLPVIQSKKVEDTLPTPPVSRSSTPHDGSRESAKDAAESTTGQATPSSSKKKKKKKSKQNKKQQQKQQEAQKKQVLEDEQVKSSPLSTDTTIPKSSTSTQKTSKSSSLTSVSSAKNLKGSDNDVVGLPHKMRQLGLDIEKVAQQLNLLPIHEKAFSSSSSTATSLKSKNYSPNGKASTTKNTPQREKKAKHSGKKRGGGGGSSSSNIPLSSSTTTSLASTVAIKAAITGKSLQKWMGSVSKSFECSGYKSAASFLQNFESQFQEEGCFYYDGQQEEEEEQVEDYDDDDDDQSYCSHYDGNENAEGDYGGCEVQDGWWSSEYDEYISNHEEQDGGGGFCDHDSCSCHDDDDDEDEISLSSEGLEMSRKILQELIIESTRKNFNDTQQQRKKQQQSKKAKKKGGNNNKNLVVEVGKKNDKKGGASSEEEEELVFTSNDFDCQGLMEVLNSASEAAFRVSQKKQSGNGGSGSRRRFSSEVEDSKQQQQQQQRQQQQQDGGGGSSSKKGLVGKSFQDKVGGVCRRCGDPECSGGDDDDEYDEEEDDGYYDEQDYDNDDENEHDEGCNVFLDGLEEKVLEIETFASMLCDSSRSSTQHSNADILDDDDDDGDDDDDDCHVLSTQPSFKVLNGDGGKIDNLSSTVHVKEFENFLLQSVFGLDTSIEEDDNDDDESEKVQGGGYNGKRDNSRSTINDQSKSSKKRKKQNSTKRNSKSKQPPQRDNSKNTLSTFTTTAAAAAVVECKINSSSSSNNNHDEVDSILRKLEKERKRSKILSIRFDIVAERNKALNITTI